MTVRPEVAAFRTEWDRLTLQRPDVMMSPATLFVARLLTALDDTERARDGNAQLDAAALDAAERAYWQDDGVSRHNLAAAIQAYLGARPPEEPPRPDTVSAGLVEFFWRCWDDARGVGQELDGGDVQAWGEDLGLLKKVVATAPCGEGCVCADYVGDDFPTDCYRPTVARGVSSPLPTERHSDDEPSI